MGERIHGLKEKEGLEKYKNGDAICAAVSAIVVAMIQDKKSFSVQNQKHRNAVCDAIKEVGSALLRIEAKV